MADIIATLKDIANLPIYNELVGVTKQPAAETARIAYDYVVELTKIKVGFWLFFAHCLLTVLYLRIKDADALPHARRNPIVSCLLTVVVCCGSSITTSIVIGERFQPLEYDYPIIAAILAWYIIYFSPFDLGIKLVKFTPIKVALSIMKEIQRVRKIIINVELAAATVFPKSIVGIVVLGTIGGCGSGLWGWIARVARGAPAHFELDDPTFSTRSSLYASIALALAQKGLVPYDKTGVAVIFLVATVLYHVVSAVTGASPNAFYPIELVPRALLAVGTATQPSEKTGTPSSAPRASAGVSAVSPNKNGKEKKH
eukprot:Opistho-2@57544